MTKRVYEVESLGDGTPDDPTRPAYSDQVDDDVEVNRTHDGSLWYIAANEAVEPYESKKNDPDATYHVRSLPSEEMADYDAPESDEE